MRNNINPGLRPGKRFALPGRGRWPVLKDLWSVIKDLWSLRRAAKEAKMDKIKSGLLTTEFWLALIGSALPLVNRYMGLNIPAEAILSVAGIVISYILGRSFVKKGK